MKKFLFLHGGSHGAWCWEGVIRELDRIGCQSHALDLPGAGNDLTNRLLVTFDSSVAAVNAFIQDKDLTDFALVGHSLAGILLPDIAAANRALVNEVVFIAAFVLNRNERAIDLVAPDRVPQYYRLAETSPEHAMMLSYDAAHRRFFNDLHPEAARSAYAKLTPQPLAPYLEPARHDASALSTMARYIICRKDQNFPPDVSRRFAEKLGGTIEEIDAGHDVMLSKPAELAGLLRERIEGTPRPFR